MALSIVAAWLSFAAGVLAGATTGLFFARPDWLGGYASWPRRMVRLGHVSFFGLGFLNLGYGLTVPALGLERGAAAPALLLVAGAVAMPLVCYLSAWRPPFRHLFCVPVTAVGAAVGLVVWQAVGR